MAKKNSNGKKSVWYYIKVYFTSLFVSLIIITVGTFLTSQTPCANSKTCESDLKVSINNNSIGTFEGQKVIPPKIDLYNTISNPVVLGASTISGEKHIYVDLNSQELYAYQGSKLFMETPISSGKWNPTPVGNFNIWEKLVSTRMAGGEGADAYDLPNVPYVMYFYHDFGLHGAYWHNNFGHEMSHGCVNMRIVDAKDLYNWADGPTKDQKGTPVSVCNKFVAPNKCIQDNPVD